MIFCGGVLPLSTFRGLRRLMNTTSLQADPAAGFPLPDPGIPVPRLTGLRHVADVAESILYWGILGLGVVLPFLGAAYGMLKS